MYPSFHGERFVSPTVTTNHNYQNACQCRYSRSGCLSEDIESSHISSVTHSKRRQALTLSKHSKAENPPDQLRFVGCTVLMLKFAIESWHMLDIFPSVSDCSDAIRPCEMRFDQ